MSIISNIGNICGFQPNTQSSASMDVQVSFDAVMEEVENSGKNDEVENSYEKSAAEKFKELMDMSIGERYFELYLKREGMTQEQFDALPPEEQEKIVREFQEEMEKSINGGNTGNTLL